MIYLVDNTIDGQGSSPREIRGALERIVPDTRIVVERFSDVSLELVKTLKPSHIVLSGQSHPWDDYSSESLASVFHMIRHAPQPILGVCGGHQQMALAFGAPVGLLGRITPGIGYEGAYRERGFCEVSVDNAEAGEGIFADLPQMITVWESHCEEVKALPPDFVSLASNSTSAIQAMQHTSRPLFGVQFHPELFDEEHPDGRRILSNFLDL